MARVQDTVRLRWVRLLALLAAGGLEAHAALSCASPFHGLDTPGAPADVGAEVLVDARVTDPIFDSAPGETGPPDAAPDAWEPKGLRITRALRGDEVGTASAECASIARDRVFLPWVWTGQGNPGASSPDGGYWSEDGAFGFATRPGDRLAVLGNPPEVWVGMQLDGGEGPTCEDWKVGNVLGTGLATNFRTDVPRSCSSRLPVLCVER
jgi:hypothetical protein